MPERRKRVKHYHEPGDVHELTFSCYQRLPLLDNDVWKGYLAESLETACRACKFGLIAFVFMPEHVHLLTLPQETKPKIGAFLAAVKRPCSVRVKQDLVTTRNPLIERLTVQERPGKTAFRFWLEGSGYDRNLQNEDTVLASLDYIHNNPVQRGLCQRPADWFWSSTRFYTSDPPRQDPRLPAITRLPAEFFTRIYVR